jgi:hypothetical protein
VAAAAGCAAAVAAACVPAAGGLRAARVPLMAEAAPAGAERTDRPPPAGTAAVSVRIWGLPRMRPVRRRGRPLRRGRTSRGVAVGPGTCSFPAAAASAPASATGRELPSGHRRVPDRAGRGGRGSAIDPELQRDLGKGEPADRGLPIGPDKGAGRGSAIDPESVTGRGSAIDPAATVDRRFSPARGTGPAGIVGRANVPDRETGRAGMIPDGSTTGRTG